MEEGSHCVKDKNSVSLVGDNSDLWGPVTRAAGKHALWGASEISPPTCVFKETAEENIAKPKDC